jgi:predicted Zn-dependent protease with MMP-like domain
MPSLDDDRIVEQIYEARDNGEFEEALRLALHGIRVLGEDPVLRFLAGVSLIDLDQPERGAEELAIAVNLDPDDAEFRAHLAYALFKSCRFGEAEAESRRALESDPEVPEAHEALALALERRGQEAEADRHLLEASRIDPEGFPFPSRMSREKFEREIRKAEERLPEEFRRHLAEVAVTVESLPSDEIVFDARPFLDPELLGLFVGVALPERTHLGPGGDLPPRILLFQRNLERVAPDADTLRGEIAVTLYHELGHYLGMDEEELTGIDLA